MLTCLALPFDVALCSARLLLSSLVHPIHSISHIVACTCIFPSLFQCVCEFTYETTISLIDLSPKIEERGGAQLTIADVIELTSLAAVMFDENIRFTQRSDLVQARALARFVTVANAIFRYPCCISSTCPAREESVE